MVVKNILQGFILTLFSIFAMLIILVPLASAQGLYGDICDQPGVDTSQNPVCQQKNKCNIGEDPKLTNCVDPNNNPIFGKNGILYRVAQIISLAVGVASVIMIIIGGLKFVLSSGDSASVKSARNTVIYAAVGLLVALAAQGIITFIVNNIAS